MSKPTKTALELPEIDASDINKYLSSQDSFQLEMAVCNECVLEGLKSTHGGTYIDPVTNKARQFDIRAIAENSKNFPQKFMRLAIECKSLKKDAPLLISRVPRSKEESFHEFIYSANRNLSNLAVVGSGTTVRVENQIYKQGQFVGKAAVQVKRNENNGTIISMGDSDIYEKWAQAISSAHDLVYHSIDAWRMSGSTVCSMVLPILVVNDKTLWAVDYALDGTQTGDPTMIEECKYYLGREIPSEDGKMKYMLSHLHIVTRKGFRNLLIGLKHTEGFWDFLFPKFALLKEDVSPFSR